MEPVWIVVAFVLGFLARQVGQPPLLGFLAAGFALKAFGAENNSTLDAIADMGIYLLLFSIGLKLRIGSLLQPQVWATASLHMGVTVGFFLCVFWGLAAVAFPIFEDLSLGGCAGSCPSISPDRA